MRRPGRPGRARLPGPCGHHTAAPRGARGHAAGLSATGSPTRPEPTPSRGGPGSPSTTPATGSPSCSASGPGEVVLTSGGTEADDLAVHGGWEAVAEGWSRPAPPPAVVCSAMEHHAVLRACRALARRHGAELREVPSGPDGRIDLDALADACRRRRRAWCRSWPSTTRSAPSSPSTRWPASWPSRSPRAVLHTDAVQAVPWLDVAGRTAPAALVSVSAHKFGGPKGSGALVVRSGTGLRARIDGGGQERGRRSGTPNVAGAVGHGRRPGGHRGRARRRRRPGGRPAGPPGRRAAGRRARRRGDRRPGRAGGRHPPPAVRRRRGRGRWWSCSTRPASPPRPVRPARAGRSSRATCWPPWASVRPRPRSGVRLLAGCHHHRRGCRPCAGPDSRRRRPPAKLGPCASWWPCPAVSTRRWPPPWWPRPTAPTTWSAPPSSCGAATSDSGCCSVADVDDARRVADQLGLVHHVFNFAADFEAHVVDPYVTGHAEGRTPNPCIECNRHLKFDRLLDRADPARVRRGGHRPPRPPGPGRRRHLAAGPGGRPGQGPVLRAGHARPGPAGPHAVPGGGADQGRRCGTRPPAAGLRTADKPDSQDVCFIRSDVGRAGFLADRVALHPGRLVDHDSGRRPRRGDGRRAGHGGPAPGDGARQPTVAAGS